MPRQSPPRVKSYSAGLDYLSLSSPKSPLEHLKFVTFAHTVQKAVPDDGEAEKSAGRKGYVGQKRAGVSVVKRGYDNHCLLIAEGENTEMVAQAAIDAGLEAKCTRADPAFTYQLDQPFPYMGSYLNREIRKFEKAAGITGRVAFTLFEKEKQDSGGTIGHRSSAVYPRIYDWMLYHHKRSDFDIWRAELETKEEAAERLWEMAKAAPDRAKLCAGVVLMRLDKYGIRPGGVDEAELVDLVGTRPPTDIERYMKWFESTVINSMEKRVDEGHWNRLFDALARRGFIDADGMFHRPCEQ
jgi:hypothetical protein